MDIQISKKEMRKKVLEKRELLSPAERSRAANLLTESVCGHPWFEGSDTILAFVSYGSEIDTTGIIERALKQGKKVYVPRVEGAELSFYRIAGPDDLQEGYKGIREPAGNTERFTYCQEEAERVLMLMPGAVFDENRNRCGYGKGFYDRYLSGKDALQMRTIGVGFRCQLVEELPAQAWDIRPSQIICV